MSPAESRQRSCVAIARRARPASRGARPGRDRPRRCHHDPGPRRQADRSSRSERPRAGSRTCARSRRGQPRPDRHGALASLQRSGAITPTTYQQDYAAYVAAERSLKKLSGTRRAELGAVLANVQAIAAAGEFIPSRLPALFLTLERNRTWWTTEPLLATRERVSFPAEQARLGVLRRPGDRDPVARHLRRGQRLLLGPRKRQPRQLLAELIPLATQRAGGIAWEYMFHFDGGVPPWTSGLSQGTALQVLARAWSRFKEPASDRRPAGARHLPDRHRRRACA